MSRRDNPVIARQFIVVYFPILPASVFDIHHSLFQPASDSFLVHESEDHSTCFSVPAEALHTMTDAYKPVYT
jgi:hypothetical protein